MDKASYALGINIGKQIKQLCGKELNVDDFVLAMKDVLTGTPSRVDLKEADKLLGDYLTKLSAKRVEKNKAAGEKFLVENSKKEGVVTLPSGLQYQVLREGNGKQPNATDKVECHYEGFLVDGTVFDSSYKRGETVTFSLNGVIAGWTEGLQLMQEGAKYRFFIPYQLGYGEKGSGQSIPPYAALVFDVELIAVK